jgi:aspartyl-tRNA(Asn)/glutamyl-tRNA(Gln) amidotransferase subunit B
MMNYEPVIGLEVHAELATVTKMFCACRVVDTTCSAPNTAVCPVCAGMPGTLPVLNKQAVELGIRAALALECVVQERSIFSRKNYFYPDLPKGYQISQYEDPLALNGRLVVDTSQGEHLVRIRRVHLEEDTGKLTHIHEGKEEYSLVDLNRAGVPLLEIVSEPDLHSLDEVHAYALTLRGLLRELGVSSGDMEKGVLRFEANVSLRQAGSETLGTRVEIKNLNSFRSMERAIAFELKRQAGLLERGEVVEQETLGWDETNQVTISQRSKEDAHDYRYFPEPDLPPLVIDPVWIERVRASLPELPKARAKRFQQQYGMSDLHAVALTSEREIAEYFEACVVALKTADPRSVVVWVTGEIFARLNQNSSTIVELRVTPQSLAELIDLQHQGIINQNTAKKVFEIMLKTGQNAISIINDLGMNQVSDGANLAELVKRVLVNHPDEVASYRAGKITLNNWFFGLAMREAGGKADPIVLKTELEKQLAVYQKVTNKSSD